MRRDLCALTLTAALLFAASRAAAGPLDASRVPAAARWVVHLDQEAVRGSALRPVLDEAASHPKVAPKLALLEALTGLDPQEDMRGVTIVGGEGGERQATVLVAGRFEREKLLLILRAMDGYEESSYGGHTIHSWPDKSRSRPPRMYGCFVGEELAVIGGHLAGVRQVLDTIDGKADAAAASPLWEGLLTAEGRPLALAAAREVRHLQDLEEKAAVLRHVESLFLLLEETQDGFVLGGRLQATTAEAAGKIRQVLLGLQALVELSDEQEPALREFAASLAVAVEGSSVSARGAVPAPVLVARLREHLREALGPVAPPATPDGAPAEPATPDPDTWE
jgi:hypothetical protein